MTSAGGNAGCIAPALHAAMVATGLAARSPGVQAAMPGKPTAAPMSGRAARRDGATVCAAACHTNSG